MGPVDVGVSHDDQLVIAGLGDVKVCPKAVPRAVNRVRISWLARIRSIEAFPRSGSSPGWQDGLGQPAPPLLGAAAGGVPFDDEEF